MCYRLDNLPHQEGLKALNYFFTKERQFFSWENFRRRLYITVNPFGCHFKELEVFSTSMIFCVSSVVPRFFYSDVFSHLETGKKKVPHQEENFLSI